ncbi:hypothetical protein BGHDH14_bgh02662 [Blumeria hordei DH14]|uniref:RNA helicase HEL117 n=1 Tax=Blumeria graminis f. sp. hordei (strain DH14) TaxID=546991 RepID=N1JFD3_BLUG1|nr:hypothetical protein BGHDH14_bgh02662 [Blumeria hordei DH14]
MGDDGRRVRNTRSLSPCRTHTYHRQDRSPRTLSSKPKQIVGSATTDVLTRPFNARELSRRDYQDFKPIFALYLDIQKGIALETLGQIEVKGRWKSFLGKWNRGELSEGWYDPSTLQRACEASSTLATQETSEQNDVSRENYGHDSYGKAKSTGKHNDDSDSDSSIGPRLPGHEPRKLGRRSGPSIPRQSDLEYQREMNLTDASVRRDEHKLTRKLTKRERNADLDELVPRAPPGTRERQLEKKKDLNEKLKSFRERSPGAVEVPEAELMGCVDGVESFKKEKQEFERKKNERELRKEENLRARMAEREERLQQYRAKEESTMAMLKALAKQRFG